MTEAEPTVFVVDDDPSVRRSTERLVRSMGFNVQTFATAKEFSERARIESPSCLVLDVHLPGMSGFELQRHLAGAGTALPVVFITARDQSSLRRQALARGCGYLIKPFPGSALLEAVAEAVAK